MLFPMSTTISPLGVTVLLPIINYLCQGLEDSLKQKSNKSILY